MRHYTGSPFAEPVRALRLVGSGSTVPKAEPAGESAEDRNARENAAKQAAGEGPQIIAGPDTVPHPEDLAEIVRHVAMKEFRSGFEFGADSIREYYPELNGITDDEILAVITEDLR